MNKLECRPLNSRLISRDFEDFFGDLFDDSFWKIKDAVPAVDVRENDSGYLLEADLPGIKEKDLRITVDKNILIISSKKKEENTEKKDNYLIKERRSSSFSRRFVLPENADPENIKAEFKDGILSLEIAKRPEAKPKRIEIKTS